MDKVILVRGGELQAFYVNGTLLKQGQTLHLDDLRDLINAHNLSIVDIAIYYADPMWVHIEGSFPPVIENVQWLGPDQR